jgi:DNA-binding NtrC family response regulator
LNRDCAKHYKGTVLIVEDEALILLELRKMLAELGWKVTFLASDLEEAQRHASKGTFDLGILDMNLKGRSSYTVAEILKTRRIPLVVASGYSQDIINAACPGAVFLQKPYLAGDLKDAIARAMPDLQRKSA